MLREGEVCGHVYYVATGCLQVYVYDSSDDETTRDILLEAFSMPQVVILTTVVLIAAALLWLALRTRRQGGLR